MALSDKVNEEILEAKSHLRNALKNAAVNEKVFVSKCIADILVNLENLEKMEAIWIKLRIANLEIMESLVLSSMICDCYKT